MEKLEFHPIAHVFPLLEGGAFATLVADVRAHGLLEPVTLYEGMILDGRNRYRACMEAGVAVRSQEWQGESGSPAEFVWSKNAERRQLKPSQRAMAAQALMPWLGAEAKARYDATVGRPKKSPPNSEAISERRSKGHAGEAAGHAAQLAGVGKTTIYDAKWLSDQAKTDPRAAGLVERVTAGTLSVNRARKILTGEVADEEDAPQRNSRSPLTLVAAPPSEDASEATKSRYAGRAVRVLADYLSSLRLDMQRQGLSLSDDALAAWWDGIEAREWEQVQTSVAWFEKTCEPLLKYVHYKMSRNSVPPMVQQLGRSRRTRKGA